jgi:CubicO group peptidase (beta-lactamase class C family)
MGRHGTAILKAAGMKLDSTPGTKFRYSDINLFTVGEIVARVSGMPLEKFCAKEIYRPLKMNDTGFLPPRSKISRIAPTEMTDGVMLRGTVHDPTARFMGGVAGHAGVFTTAPDMARFARMMLNMGELDGKRIFKPETVKLMTSVQTPPGMEDRRGLGWDIDSGIQQSARPPLPPRLLRAFRLHRHRSVDRSLLENLFHFSFQPRASRWEGKRDWALSHGRNAGGGGGDGFQF